MPKVNTFVVCTIRDDLFEQFARTLYAKTPHNFYLYLVDNSPGGIAQDLINKYVHLYIRPRRNLGFAKGTNMGLRLADTEYVTMVNDDVEFMDKRWWDGIVEAFKQVDAATPQRPCISVTPGSVKLPDWSVGRASGDDFYILPYKEEYTKADYDFMLNEEHYINEHLTIKPNTIIDGITFYCSVFRTKLLKEVGYLNERYYPGGAEDYDYCCRAYMNGYRAVSTTKSWVFHHWSKSINSTHKAEIRATINPDLAFGDHTEIWGPQFDLWGIKCTQEGCGEHLALKDGDIAVCPKHLEETYKMPENTVIPL